MQDNDFERQVEDRRFVKDIKELHRKEWSNKLKAREQECKREVMQIKLVIFLIIFAVVVILIFYERWW